MKYVVTSTLLYGRLQTIDRVIMPKNNIPILTCFLFNVKDGVMEITGTDNETTLKCSLQLNQSDGDACFAVPSKQLLDILKEIPEQPLSIDFNPTTLQIDLSYQ